MKLSSRSSMLRSVEKLAETDREFARRDFASCAAVTR